MHAAASRDRPAFVPPTPAGQWASFGLAVLAHLLLLAGLASVVAWNHQPATLAVEAELWSAVPSAAAPRPMPLPPPPPPAPVVRPAPAAPPEPPGREAAIARARQQAASEAAARQREAADIQRRAHQARQQEAARRREAEQRAAEQQAAERQAAERRRAAEHARHQEAEARELEAQRRANLERLTRLAGATGTGSTDSRGTASRASGPSAGYAGRVAAAVRPNIVYPEAVSGNPRALVEVRTSPDGTIVSRRIRESSGNRSWDEAVLRALDRTERLPRDVDGRVPAELEIGFRPQD